jgi:SAM-dependent methyltransferase
MEAALQDQFAQIDETHWWFQGRRRVVASVLRGELALVAGQDLRIFDIGCGTGEMLDMLREFGSVEAIDSSADAVQHCKNRFGERLDVHVGVVPRDLPRAGSADVVTAFDVIEHIDDDREALSYLHRVLRPGGTLVVTVPAFAFLWGPHDLISHHYRRYNAPQLRRRLVEAGFTVERLTYFNTLLFPVVAALRLLRRLVGEASPRSDFRELPASLNRVLLALFSLEAALVTRFSLPVGVSLLAVCTSGGG